ncbi:hypothetical protein F4818DRAFT_363581 [Hypoxylon cercidicola]|nr:hypothetical protein F4818DRAFT_363581 [Hypoxylon cercidicola]
MFFPTPIYGPSTAVSVTFPSIAKTLYHPARQGRTTLAGSMRPLRQTQGRVRLSFLMWPLPLKGHCVRRSRTTSSRSEAAADGQRPTPHEAENLSNCNLDLDVLAQLDQIPICRFTASAQIPQSALGDSGQASDSGVFTTIYDETTGESTLLQHGRSPAPVASDDNPGTYHLSPSFEEPSFLFPPFDLDWKKPPSSQISRPDSQVPATPGRNIQSPPRSVEYVACLGDNFFDNTAPWSEFLQARRTNTERKQFKDVTITETTREQILVVAQTFFRLALDRLSISSNPGCQFLVVDRKKHSSSTVLLLPPTTILSIYLETFVTSFEPFFPMFSQRSLDPNTIYSDAHQELSVLFFLLMFSYGAVRDSAIKARRLSKGLLEISRLALFDILDKDNSTPRNEMTSHCALICVYQSAFSGYKRLVDSSLGQIQMYLTIARQSGFFNREKSERPDLAPDLDDEEAWQEWMRREACTRLAYCWVMVDQEVSLLYDCTPALTMLELGTCLPESDDLWLANEASAWRKSWNERYGSASGSPPSQDFSQLSLRQLFGLLLEDRINVCEHRLSILHMRLLLYPLHIMICQLCESLSYSTNKPLGRLSQPVSQILTTLRFDEIKSLRRTWHDTFVKLEPKNTRERTLKQSALVLFHLLNLKLAVSFPQLEQYFREVSAHSDAAHHLLEIGIRAPEEAMVHCGQVLRVLREMEIELRPLWWPAAVYRVAIILRALGTSAPATNRTATEVPIDVVVDASSPDSHAFETFLKYGRGRPCLKCEDGTLAPLKDVGRVLRICIGLLRQHVSASSLAEELIQKLETAANLEDGNATGECGSL